MEWSPSPSVSTTHAQLRHQPRSGGIHRTVCSSLEEDQRCAKTLDVRAGMNIHAKMDFLPGQKRTKGANVPIVFKRPKSDCKQWTKRRVEM